MRPLLRITDYGLTMSSTLQEQTKFGFPAKQGLYDPAFEKDSCGVGFVAHIKGKASHQIVVDAEKIGRASCRERVLRLV